MPITLPAPFYYLENFQRVLDWIVQRYSDLLTDDERSFIEQFPTLPQASRALLVRMVMRKGQVFRSGKLRYAEIGCPDAAAAPLLTLGWIVANPPLDVAQLFALLRKAELVQAFRFPATGSVTKDEMFEQLAQTFPVSQPLSAVSYTHLTLPTKA